MIRSGLVLVLAALLALPTMASPIDARWTKAAEVEVANAVLTNKRKFMLPEVRVYDRAGRLILHEIGGGQGTARKVAAAIARPKVIAGPTLAQSLAELETTTSAPLTPAIIGNARFVVIDYWAEWCAPCKVIAAELDRWQAAMPAGRVALIRAETDFIKAAQRVGTKVRIEKNSSNK